MTYDELMATIRKSSFSDWHYSDEKGVFTFRADLDIRIERRLTDYECDRTFKEEWATKFPDPDAKLRLYDIYYRSSFVETFLLVSVDGHKAALPMPLPKSKYVPKKTYDLARAVDYRATLDDYMGRAGFTVVPD